MEVEAQARKLLLQQIKLGWLICKTVTTWLQADVLNVPDLTIDFASAEERKPTLCAESHKLKKCTASPTACKCINCLTYNKQNQHKNICDSYPSLDASVKSNIGEVQTKHRLLKWRDTVTPTQNTAIERTNCKHRLMYTD